MEIDFLLNEMTALRKAYQLVGEQPGERFNIFSVLGLESNEVRTHSQFLAELLSPKGSHGMGDVFLKTFLRQFKIDEFEAVTAKVTAEYFIGKVSDTDGGRIDLLLESKGRRIVIENKIFAGDQPNQLLRYFNFDKTARLYYLTRFGGRPGEGSTGNGQLLEEQYDCISYEKHILEWLEECRKEATHIPNVRETIAQYISLIKQLTNQNFNSKMAANLVDKILSNPEHVKSFIELQAYTNEVYNRLIQKWEAELKKVARETGLELNYYLKSGSKWKGIAFYGGKDLSELGIQIDFQFDVFPKGLFFGFSYPIDKSNPKIPASAIVNLPKLKSLFQQEFHGCATNPPWWACYKWWDGISPAEVCEGILSGKIDHEIKERVLKMLKIAEDLNNHKE